MFTVNDVHNEYRRLDTISHVDTSHIQLKISQKGINRFGYCKSVHVKNGQLTPVEISFSDMIFEDESLFWQTIRHEYAHALVTIRDGKAHGHDWVWKLACKEIGCAPRRLINTENSEIVKQREADLVKYTLACRNCGWERRYFRKGKVVKNFLSGRKQPHYFCPKCGRVEGQLRLLTKEELNHGCTGK